MSMTCTYLHIRTKNYKKSTFFAPKTYSHELVDLIFMQPYCRISNLVESGIAQRQTASKVLKELVSLEVLREVAVGREKVFINLGLMSLLNKP